MGIKLNLHKIPPDIFMYQDYVLYMKDMFAYHSFGDPSIDMDRYSSMIGVPQDVLQNVFDGRCHLPERLAGIVGQAFEFEEWQYEYFVALVEHNSCHEPLVKVFLGKKLEMLKPDGGIPG